MIMNTLLLFLLQSPPISHNRDDMQSMDSSSWNLLIYIWRHNKSISVLASFHSLSRSCARGKVNADDSGVTFADFDESERCKVMSLAPLDKPALSLLVARILRSSGLSDSQVRTIDSHLIIALSIFILFLFLFSILIFIIFNSFVFARLPLSACCTHVTIKRTLFAVRHYAPEIPY